MKGEIFMSKRERNRRQLASSVFKEAWRLYKKGVKWFYSFSSCLKLAWRTVRNICGFKFSKVKGVSFNNDNGISRQEVIRALAKYDYKQISLSFERESSNQYDRNAIKIIAKVTNLGSAQIGYLSKEIAAYVAPKLDIGYSSVVVLEQITGSSSGNLGVNLKYALYI